MSQLKKGAALSYITIILTNIVGLVLTPFIIKKLGDAEYGLYTLIGAFVGYISVLDFGLNNTIVRFVAKYRAEKDKQGEESFLGTTMFIYGIISLVILFCGVLLYYNLDSIFSSSLTSTELEKAKVMFVILIFNLAITLPGGAFAAICSGYEHFVFPRAVNIGRYIFRSLMVVGLLMYGGDAVGLVILDTIMNILVIVLNSIYVFKKLNVDFKFNIKDLFLVREIFSYSIWIFVFAVVGQFQWKASQIVLGSLTNTTMVAIYAIGVMLGTYYGAFSTAISGVFLPRATKMIVKNASGYELTMMMVKIGRISLVVLLLILGGFVLFGEQFIDLWVGENYKESWFIALVIMIVYTVPLVQAFGNLILEAKSKFRFKAIVYISFIVVGLVLGSFLVPSYGLKGMVIGASTGWLLSVIIMNVYYQREIKLSILLFFRELLRSILPTYLIIMLIGFFINKIPGNDWFNLLIKIFLYSLVFIVLIVRFGLNKNEHEMFKGFIQVKKNKNVYNQ
ncbi:lipopolysaccharide biosynthesis protein [Tenacibaculum crassostreae]|uniref:lipopolysaccharide biosynthesis protein n=1 Tax=Tenacibaculum crassostreae TaxID=502683 RepID=UPI00389413A0